jgi:hypothetical protein
VLSVINSFNLDPYIHYKEATVAKGLVFPKKRENKVTGVSYCYNPSYWGRGSRKILSSRLAWAMLVKPYLKNNLQNKRAGAVALS